MSTRRHIRDQIYSRAKLFNMQPKLPDEATVLERGCASVGNLITVAVQLPSAKFVGADLSPEQITQSQNTVSRLKLTNIDFRGFLSGRHFLWCF